MTKAFFTFLALQALIVGVQSQAATNLTADMNAILTKAGGEASINGSRDPRDYDQKRHNAFEGWEVVKTNIHGKDERRPLEGINEQMLPEEYRLTDEEKKQLTAAGRVRCETPTESMGSGFLVDQSDYLSFETKIVLATSPHVLFDRNGNNRGPCYFRPAGSEREYLLDTRSRNITRGEGNIYDRRPEGEFAFVNVTGMTPVEGQKFGRIKISFENVYDYSLPDEAKSLFLNAHHVYDKFVKDRKNGGKKRKIVDRLEVSLNCMPGTKSGYLYENTNVDMSKQIEHDCDFNGKGSGGGLFMRTPDGLRAIAINVGDIDVHAEGRHIEHYKYDSHDGGLGVPYIPGETFNYGRRLDLEIETEFKKHIGVFQST